MRFDFVTDFQTVHTLGLTIAQHVLIQATQLIQWLRSYTSAWAVLVGANG